MKKGKNERVNQDKIKLCPKCASSHLNYSPGIDIGLMYATCLNCGFRANQNIFPNIGKRQASKLKVIKGKKLAELQSKNITSNLRSKWIGIVAVIILITVILALILK